MREHSIESNADEQGQVQANVSEEAVSSENRTSKKRKRIVRNFPAIPVEDSLQFARQIFEFGSGEPVRKLSLFNHLNKGPESSLSRQIIINAGKYGIIKGGIQADFLELTQEGLRCVNPEVANRERVKARVQVAIDNTELFSKLFERLVNKALPAKQALIDAAVELGASVESAQEAVEIFIVNLRFVGLLKTLSGAERIVSRDYLIEELPPTNEDGYVSQIRTDQGTSNGSGQALSEHTQFDRVCFYITPIGHPESEQRKHSDLFLGSIVEPAIQQFDLDIVRADKIEKPGIITRHIIEYIIKSKLVIVDLSYHNPNVFYELAIRHMMRRPIVQIIRKADNIPFDINQMRTIIIDTTDIYTLVPRIQIYQAEISSQIRRAMEDSDAVETPISTYFPGLKAGLSVQ